MTQTHSVVSDIWCNACSTALGTVQDAEEFCKVRADTFLAQTGGDNPWVTRDMFYREFEVSDVVVYPTMSGRSCQISAAEVVEINPNKKADPHTPDELWAMQAKLRIGEPYSLKLGPIGVSSRWKQHNRWVAPGATPTKTVTTWANAGSAVLIEL